MVVKYISQEGLGMCKDVYAHFLALPKHEQIRLFKLLKEDFFSDEERNLTDPFTSI